MADASTLLDAVRTEAKPGIWSLGVGLARAGAVALQSQSAAEVELRVRPGNRPVPFTVVLYPPDLAWECNCPSKVDPCEHVVAAAIGLDQADKQQAPLAEAKLHWTRLIYGFTRTRDGLALERWLVHADGRTEKLEGTVVAALAKPQLKASLQLEEADLLADRLLERPTRTALHPERLQALLKILQGARNVQVDGREVAVAEESVLPIARVTDEGDGFELVLMRDPRVTAVVCPGVALCGDVLARLGETTLTGNALEQLPTRKHFSAAQLGELTSRLLPDLARRVPLQILSKRLPAIDPTLKPRVDLQLTQIDAGLSVLPLLVYGAPAHVRIDNGRLIHLHGSVPIRDEAAEQRLVQQFRQDLDLLPGRRSTINTADLPRFVAKLQSWQGGLSGDTQGLVRGGVRLSPNLVLTSHASGTALPSTQADLSFTVEGARSPEQIGAEQVLRAWREGLGLVPLAQGGFAPLPVGFLEKHGQRIADLLAARGADGSVATHALPGLADLCDALEQPKPPGLEHLQPLIEGFERLPAAQLPEDLNAQLRPYQQHGVAWLQFLIRTGLGGVLADDMGLGKTLQAICVASKGTLVVCPTSVLPNWQAELKRFRPNLRVSVYHGPGRALDPTADITLTSYALLRLDAAQLGAQEWKLAVLDEAQAIKNPDSQVARAAYALKATTRLALTGTPLENRLDELWSLLHFTNTGLLGGRRAFDAQVAQPAANGDTAALSRLRKKIRPFILRRLKRDVAPELPPKSEAVLRVELSSQERAIYDAVLAATRKDVVALLEQGGGVLKALEALLRLRQAACHPALVPGQQAASSSKLEALLEAIATAVADGHKVLVFSQWTSLLDLVEPALQAEGVEYLRLDGSTRDRGAVTAKFQAADGPPVMILSLKAAGVGLNLTAADHVFLLDPWWNPAVEAQATDRAHRIGQERPVLVYRLVAQNTVEEKILALQDQKRGVFEAALSESGVATSLTRDDLLALFD